MFIKRKNICFRMASTNNVCSDRNNKIVKNTGLLYTRQLITLFITLYTYRLTLQVLGETDFGIYAAVGGITTLLSTLTTSLSSGTQRFITFELGRGDLLALNKVYCTSINIHIILSIILVIAGELFGSWFVLNKMNLPSERVIVAFWVFQLTLLNCVLSIINAPNVAEIIAHEDMGTWALVSIIDTLLRLCAVILLFFISWDKLLAYAIALFLIQFFNRVICMQWCKRKYEEVHYKFIWDGALVRSMMSISGWLSISNMAITGFIQGVNILLNIFFGPILNAAYTIAMQAYSGIRQFCSSFQLAANPQIIKLYSVNKLEEMKVLLYSVCKMSFYLVFFLSLPFIINASYVFNIWLKEVPDHTESFFILLLIYALIDVLAYPLDIAAQATGKIKIYSLLISLMTLSILLFAYLAYLLGCVPESIYMIAIVVSWCCLFARIKCLNKLMGMKIIDFFRNVLLKIIIVGIISCVIPILFKFYFEQTSLFILLLNFVISFLSVGLVIYYWGLTKSERFMLISMIRKIQKKLSFK